MEKMDVKYCRPADRRGGGGRYKKTKRRGRVTIITLKTNNYWGGGKTNADTDKTSP